MTRENDTGALAEVVTQSEGAVGRPGGGGATRWIAAVVTTVLLHGAAFVLFNVPVPTVDREPPPRPRMAWMGSSASDANSLLGEQFMLFDNAPLFLPTRWNAAAGALGDSRGLSAVQVFDEFQTELNVAPGRTPEVLPILPKGIETPLEGAREFEFDLFSAFGRADREPAQLPSRLARMEVRDAFSGRVVGARDVSPEDAPGSAEWPDWEPFEVLIDVDAAGWQVPPMVVRGSGSQTVDVFFRRYLRQHFRPQLEFGPGYYRILVGP